MAWVPVNQRGTSQRKQRKEKNQEVKENSRESKKFQENPRESKRKEQGV
jgi:hypothetical protein